MLIKSVDDKSKRITLLAELMQSDRLNVTQKSSIEKELHALRTGHTGEQSAAHYINTYFANSPNHAVIHDLRLKVGNQVAQIDHLIISRGWYFYLIETKNFGGDLSINGRGEFSVKYDNNREFGIESPIEQSKRHEVVLKQMLEQLGIQGRTSDGLVFRHVVLVHPRAKIERPDSKAFNTDLVMKADQFKSWHERFVEKEFGVIQVFKTLLNVVGSDTLREAAEKLNRQHKPVDPLALPDWLKPAPAPKAQELAMVAEKLTTPVKLVPAKPKPPEYFCASCKNTISKTVFDFCMNRKDRFGGRAYCMPHQSNF